MRTPVVLPDLRTGDEPVRISAWLVDPGDTVAEGDRLVEVLIRGITFDVASPTDGQLTKIVRPFDALVTTGDVLAWIETTE